MRSQWCCLSPHRLNVEVNARKRQNEDEDEGKRNDEDETAERCIKITVSTYLPYSKLAECHLNGAKSTLPESRCSGQ
jgi:hypothetical protein